jgi:HAD superfamily hydrolase (TIGR01509 family)
MSFKTILFDWGGVITRGGAPDEIPGRISKLVNIEPAKLRPLLKELTGPLKVGEITVEDFWSQLEQKTQAEIPVAKRDIWASMAEMQPQNILVDYTENLKQRGYTVAILSNTFSNTASDIEAQGWYQPYSPVFLSSTVGLAKPDQAFYDYALAHLGNTADEIIFIDDQQRCLDPAANMGMATILAQNPQQIIDDIERLLNS